MDGWPRRMRVVGFTVLGDWSPTGYRNVFVWIAFPERLVAFGERNGPDNDAGVWRAEEFLPVWSERLVERGWEWVGRVVERLALGEDPETVRSDAVAEYARRHDGAQPSTEHWNLDADAYRSPGT